MNKEQAKTLLSRLRQLNFGMIKAQDSNNHAQEEKFEIYLNGIAFALNALGHEDLWDTFLECECGHNFSLTGNETEDELKKHYEEMDSYYDLLKSGECVNCKTDQQLLELDDDQGICENCAQVMSDLAP